jgi:3-hydroxyisobutyrate dehydrogenase
VLKARGSVIATLLKGGEAGPVTFDIDSGRKDLHTMLAEGERRGIAMPLVAGTLKCFDEASRDGWGARDATSLPVYWSGKTA